MRPAAREAGVRRAGFRAEVARMHVASDDDDVRDAEKKTRRVSASLLQFASSRSFCILQQRQCGPGVGGAQLVAVVWDGGWMMMGDVATR